MPPGQFIDGKGYWRYGAGTHRGQRVHRVLASARLGRALRRDEVVHHVDGNKLNNDLANLVVMGEREHNAISAKQRWYLVKHVWPREQAEWEEWHGIQTVEHERTISNDGDTRFNPNEFD